MRKLRQLYKTLKENKKVILQWIFLFLVIPIIAGYIIMRPKFREEKIPIPGDNGTPNPIQFDSFRPTRQINIAQSDINEDFWDALFGTSLLLKWDYFCLHNNNDVYINKTKIKVPFENDTEAGGMEIKIDYLDNKDTSSIFTRIGERECYPVKKSSKNITAIFRKPSPTTYDLIFKNLEIRPNGGTLELEQSSYVNTEGSFITRKQYWGEFVRKEVIIIFGWIVLMVNLKDSFHFFKKK